MTAPDAMLPLAGYRVLELAHMIAGPVCGMYLADMGADVVKVEEPGEGDSSRTVYPVFLNGEGPLYLTVNRNKRSVALDLRSREGRDAYYRLVGLADVVIEAYRGGVSERLGIDYTVLASLNPRLVYCSLTAFGPDGPWRERPGVDALVQAVSGILASTGEPGGPPALCGAPLIDTLGSFLAASGILTALLHRERTGRGQRVDVSLLDGALLAGAGRLAVFHATGRDAQRLGSAHPELVPYQAFRARDGWIYVAVRTEKMWRAFCRTVGRPELADDPRFAEKGARLARRSELVALLEAILITRSVAEWMEVFDRADVLCAPVQGYPEVVRDAQVLASGMLPEQDHPTAGRIRTVGVPVRLGATPGTIRTASPLLGKHTEEVLREAGYGDAEMRRLREAGAI